MLPNFRNDNEKKAFAQKIYDMFLQDPRVTNMLKKDGTPALSTQWPFDSVEAELNRNKGKKLMQDNGGPWPITRMDDMTNSAFRLLRAAENIIYTDNITSAGIEREMDEIGSTMNLFQNPKFCEPLSTMKDYLDGYGKGATGSPIMNFFMGVSQTINNVVLTNDIMCQEPNALSDKEEEQLINAKQEELELHENELAQMCAENDINPSPDEILHAFMKSSVDTINARNEMSQKIREAAKAKDQVEGIDADKVLSEINEMENRRASLKQESSKLDLEASALHIFEERKILVPLSHFSEERNRIEKEQYSIDQSSQKFTALLENATKEKEKFEKEYDQLIADKPELTELSEKYDELVNRDDYLDFSVDKISKAFAHINEGNTKINRYLQGKIDASDLDKAERDALDAYQKAKEEIIADKDAEDIDKQTLSDLFEQAEKSDNMSIGSMLLKEDGTLKTRLKEVRQAKEKLTDKNPDIKKKQDLEDAIEKQEDIIKEHTRNLESLKNNQDVLNYSKEDLTRREKNFNKEQIRLMEANNALPKNKTKDELLNSNPSKVVNTMRNAFDQKEKAINKNHTEIKKIDADLKPKKETAAKIKIAKESAPELLKLQKKVQDAENKTKVMENIYTKGLKVENILSQRESSVNKLRADNAMKRENAVREGFTKTLQSLKQQVPEVKGEKNSPEYDNMRKGLNELLEKMKNSSYKAEDRAKDFGNLQELAQKYLDEKDKQWRPFPSQKRKDRQRLAQDIVTFCKNSKKLSAETPSVNPDVLHEAARRDPNWDPLEGVKQKFKDQMKPKVEAEKAKLQKKVDQPVNQAQKQQNKTSPSVSQLS